MWEGGFEGGNSKDPKGKNFEILLSPPRGGWEAEDKNVKKLNVFFIDVESQNSNSFEKGIQSIT